MQVTEVGIPGERLVLVRWSGDIGTKAEATRRRFLGRMVANLRDALRSEGLVHRIERSRDRVFVGLAPAELARATSVPVIASGGLAGIDDVKALLQPDYAMLEGAITGRALYDGRLDAREALALLAGATP